MYKNLLSCQTFLNPCSSSKFLALEKVASFVQPPLQLVKSFEKIQQFSETLLLNFRKTLVTAIIIVKNTSGSRFFPSIRRYRRKMFQPKFQPGGLQAQQNRRDSVTE